MIFREATVDDIPQLQRVRNSVKENVLSDPALVSDADCGGFMTVRGKGEVKFEMTPDEWRRLRNQH